MGDVVNLNRFRKQKEREEKSRQAAINRVKHGATKAERQRQDATRAKTLRDVDGHRLERSDRTDPENGPGSA